MVKSAADYLKLGYMRIFVPEEDGQFSASILEFRGCYEYGGSLAEAYERLESVAVAWIEAELSRGKKIPLPVDHKKFAEFQRSLGGT